MVMLPIPVSVSVPEREGGSQLTPPLHKTFISLRFSKVSGVWTGYCESRQSGLGIVPSPGPDSVLVQIRPSYDPGSVPGSESLLFWTPVTAFGSGWVPVPPGFGPGSECVLFRSLNPAAGAEERFRAEA